MIYFLIPVYNESVNIQNLYGQLSALNPGEEVFFVFSDDGSTDDTVTRLQSVFAEMPHIVLGDGINRGAGAAFETGFQWVLGHSRSTDDRVVTVEADCTSDPGILPVMLMLSKAKYDLVLASVYAQGGGFDRTSFLRRLISAIANLLFRFIFKIHILTLSSFYRVYRISMLSTLKDKYPGGIVTEKGFVCMLEVLLKAVRHGFSVIEVPMRLDSSKRKGKSKMKILNTTVRYFAFLFRAKVKGF